MDVEGAVRRGERVLKGDPFNEWKRDYYRVPSFPLIEAGVTHGDIVKSWQGRPECDFPPISNCVMCLGSRYPSQSISSSGDNVGLSTYAFSSRSVSVCMAQRQLPPSFTHVEVQAHFIASPS